MLLLGVGAPSPGPVSPSGAMAHGTCREGGQSLQLTPRRCERLRNRIKIHIYLAARGLSYIMQNL